MSDITPMAAVPSEVNYGRIRANFVAFIADDNGNVLEDVPLEGNVILTPTVGVLRFPSTSPPRTAVIQTLQCPVIGGILYPPGTPLGGPFPSQTGVAAVASDQPAGLPTTVQWTASFSLENTSAQPNPVTFEVPSGGVVDLTTVMPATPEPGIVVVVSTESRDRAEAAAATATQKASAAASSATAAATSATNAETSATAAASAADDAMQAASQAAADADQSRVGAAASALAAAASEQAAVAAQEGLVVAREAAAGSASSAATSASEAVSSASSAATARSGADAAAATATQKALAAASSATAAATSATNAETSATAAAGSASNAAASATAAANSAGSINWNGLSGKPAVIAAGATKADARAAIDAAAADSVGLKDTGWRNISSLVNAEFTGVTVYLRRSGSTVQIMVDIPTQVFSKWPPDSLVALPVGFRAWDFCFMPFYNYTATALSQTSAFLYTSVSVRGTVHPYRVAGSYTWLTSDAFPNTLPGTPA